MLCVVRKFVEIGRNLAAISVCNFSFNSCRNGLICCCEFSGEKIPCVSCGLPRPCSPCAAREIGEILVALSYVFKCG
ncbi:hypothetical protein SLEP1_g31383 [Rubroshorea leprosula]|uniref:Uncharacterized protein n=1 Tax=Rubroshorea leprosula TaxID=152421 RepID=A0AAV5KB75_9ROSI|nr:hypothetical protein SLEP1_g31383 [Rubroshorea leprosula]